MIAKHPKNIIRRFSALGVALLLTFGMAAPLKGEAQVLYGSVVGNVKDPGGAAVAGAKVTITNRENNLSRETTTDDTGSYSFSTIPTGNYEVKISATGFKTFTKTEVPVTLNNLTRVDLSLEVGAVAENITVTAETALLQTDRAEVRAELNEKALKDLPVPLGRNYQHLFKTLPGFTPPANAHSIPTNPSRSLVFNVNGVSNSINNTRIDGASSTNPWLPHITAYVPSLESIETVNVVTNSFDAEQGLAGGAAVNVQLKSGTNEFHGSLFEYHHNRNLRARNFFLPKGVEKGKFNLNQYGATMGGPIKKDKLFFFVSYEGTNDHQDANRRVTVPTAAMRRGDFSAFAPGVVIYDPATGNADGSGRQAFPNNVIPASRLDPIVLKIVERIPMPNLPGETNNYFAQAPFAFDRWTIDSKVTYNLTDRLNMFGRFSVLDFSTKNGTVFGDDLEGEPIAGFSNAGRGGGNTYNFSVGANYLLTPNFIIDGNFGFVRLITNSEHPSVGENIGLDLLGIPGTNGPEAFQAGWPRFDVTGYHPYGTAEHFMPYYRSDDNFQYVTNFNWRKGAHEFRWGMDLYQMNMNHTQPEFPFGESRGARGRFDFSGGPTTIRGTSATQFHAFANFLLGLPTRLGKNLLTVAPYATRNWQYSFYFRDRWQPTQRLTLSYGTRWEYFPIPTRADRGFERYDFETNQMLIGGVGSVPEDLGVEVSKKMFAPRFGLAYRATDTFIIRAGYGITNDPYPLARPLRTNHPVLIELDIQGSNSFQPAGRLANGIPPIIPIDLGDGVIDIPSNVTAHTLPEKFRRGYVQSWNLTLQKELKWGFVGEVGYVASRQIRQLGFLELNWSPINGGNAGRQLFKKFGRTAVTRLASPIGGSHYDSMQARLQRRFANGYTMDVNYTWGKSIGIADASNSDNIAPVQIPELYFLNRALSNFDRTHNLQISNAIELPFGKGRRWLNEGGVVSAIVGGWQINNIISFYSGTPFSITASGTSLNAPGSSQTADQVKPDVKILGGVGPGQPYFDPFAFAPVNEPRFGTSGRNILRGPGVNNWDFGLFREFTVTERVKVQFRAEAFNLTNTPHFNNPSNNVSNLQKNPDGTFKGGFGEITSSFGEREIRFGLRISF